LHAPLSRGAGALNGKAKFHGGVNHQNSARYTAILFMLAALSVTACCATTRALSRPFTLGNDEP